MTVTATDLSQVINYAEAPLSQWEIVIGAPPSEGKAQEDALIYPHIVAAIEAHQAKSVVNFIADEGRLEIYLHENSFSLLKLTHLTLQGNFAEAAKKNVADFAPPNHNITVTTDPSQIAAGSHDAVICNMILGCVTTSTYHKNLTALIDLAAEYLKPTGAMVIVRPNPEEGEFATYQCLTPIKDLKPGDDYDFIVRGLEDYGVMKNPYTPDSFIDQFMQSAGFKLGPTQKICQEYQGKTTTPFLLNVCKRA